MTLHDESSLWINKKKVLEITQFLLVGEFNTSLFGARFVKWTEVVKVKKNVKKVSDTEFISLTSIFAELFKYNFSGITSSLKNVSTPRGFDSG